MSQTRPRRAAITALAIVALLASGCGSGGHTASASGATRRTPPATGLSVTAYIIKVSELGKPIEAASGPFFHAAAADAVRLHAARALQRAYATAARRLAAIRPPTVAAIAQRNLIGAWSTAAADLARVIDHRPFRYGQAYAVAAAEEQPTASAADAVLTLP